MPRDTLLLSSHGVSSQLGIKIAYIQRQNQLVYQEIEFTSKLVYADLPAKALTREDTDRVRSQWPSVTSAQTRDQAGP